MLTDPLATIAVIGLLSGLRVPAVQTIRDSVTANGQPEHGGLGVRRRA